MKAKAERKERVPGGKDPEFRTLTVRVRRAEIEEMMEAVGVTMAGTALVSMARAGMRAREAGYGR